MVDVSDWFTQLSEPIWRQSAHPSLGIYSYNSYFGGPDPHLVDWVTALSEPVWVRSRHPALAVFHTRAPKITPFAELLNDWFQPFSEPVRSKPLLTAARMPFWTIGINYVEFFFNVLESGDTSAFSLTVNVPKKLARTAISEIQTYPARVTIREIKYTRGYS